MAEGNEPRPLANTYQESTIQDNSKLNQGSVILRIWGDIVEIQIKDIKLKTIADWTTIATVPAGYRIKYPCNIPLIGSNGNTVCLCYIGDTSTGAIQLLKCVADIGYSGNITYFHA